MLKKTDRICLFQTKVLLWMGCFFDPRGLISEGNITRIVSRRSKQQTKPTTLRDWNHNYTEKGWDPRPSQTTHEIQPTRVSQQHPNDRPVGQAQTSIRQPPSELDNKFRCSAVYQVTFGDSRLAFVFRTDPSRPFLPIQKGPVAGIFLPSTKRIATSRRFGGTLPNRPRGLWADWTSTQRIQSGRQSSGQGADMFDVGRWFRVEEGCWQRLPKKSSSWHELILITTFGLCFFFVWCFSFESLGYWTFSEDSLNFNTRISENLEIVPLIPWSFPSMFSVERPLARQLWGTGFG